MMLIGILLNIYVIIGVITVIIGFLNQFYNLNEVFVFLVRIFIGIIYLMGIVLLVEIFLEIF